MEDKFLAQQEDFCARLAKSNINILNITERYIFYEYQFRMANGQTKWTKTVYIRRTSSPGLSSEVGDILDIVREIRKGVE